MNLPATLLKRIRKQNNLTQRPAAKEWGVSFSILRRWEQGTSSPTLATLMRIPEVEDLLTQCLSPQEIA
jgi:transcriptional regulator with XRE-family HTH domain